MEPDDTTLALLREIRDLQREHLETYRQVTTRSLELQERAVNRQQELGRLYKVFLVVAAPLVMLCLWVIYRVMQYF